MSVHGYSGAMTLSGFSNIVAAKLTGKALMVSQRRNVRLSVSCVGGKLLAVCLLVQTNMVLAF